MILISVFMVGFGLICLSVISVVRLWAVCSALQDWDTPHDDDPPVAVPNRRGPKGGRPGRACVKRVPTQAGEENVPTTAA
jgi:hypothetical protein